MCGRFVSASSPERIARYFDVTRIEDRARAMGADYNVAPTREVLAVNEEGDERVLGTFRWGLVPSWADDPRIGSRMINARAETVATKPSFRAAFVRRRCIVPADGFYEWIDDPDDRRRQPFFIHRADGEPLAFAGLWEIWRPDHHDASPSGQQTLLDAPDGVDGDGLRTCTIITTASRGPVARLHDRMPVMLDADQCDAWLSPQNHDRDMLSGILEEGSSAQVTFHPVSKEVNSTRSRGHQLAEPTELVGAWVPRP